MKIEIERNALLESIRTKMYKISDRYPFILMSLRYGYILKPSIEDLEAFDAILDSVLRNMPKEQTDDTPA